MRQHSQRSRKTFNAKFVFVLLNVQLLIVSLLREVENHILSVFTVDFYATKYAFF